MSNIFRDAINSLAHGRRHMATLESEVRCYFAYKPYRQVIDFDPSGPTDIHKLKLVRQLPDAISHIAFDAVINLRSALDQAGYAVAIADGRLGKQAGFPFGETEADASSQATRNSREIPGSVLGAMLNARPYRDGDADLWALNRLANQQKHRFVNPMAIYSGGANMHARHFSTDRGFTFPPHWDMNNEEMVLAKVPHRAHIDVNMQIHWGLAFSSLDGVLDQSCAGVLGRAADSVEKVIEAIDREARVLGLN